MISNVMKAAKLRQLYANLSNFELFSKFKSAKKKNHFMETALCKVYNDLIINNASCKCTLLFQLDLSAAFDIVNVTLLLW